MTDKEMHISFYNAALTGILASNSVRRDCKSIEIVAMEVADRSLILFRARWKGADKPFRTSFDFPSHYANPKDEAGPDPR